ncbi:MAG: HD domain-containing protein [Parcubacteria group bacterium]|nr:HD domain-containing protein [Parcubacteria group bacterium]
MEKTSKKTNIPGSVAEIAGVLRKNGFKAYFVGGCVRDLLLGRDPKDWDIAANARPEEVMKIFPDSFCENKFGTVGVKAKMENGETEIVEVTTFRKEGKYSDFRRPDEIKFAETIEEDLARRDFTVNALALNIAEGMAEKIIDPFNGQSDIQNKIIRAVGDPRERFGEDALRLMRAVRFACQLNFTIAEETAAAIKEKAGLLEAISKERIRDELQKTIMSPKAAGGIAMLEDLGLLRHILPELREGLGVGQNKHHIYGVWEHNLRALDYAASNGYSFEVRTASLLHDVGKPRSKRGEGPDSTFYAHEIIGGKMTARLLDNLKFSKETVEKITHLVRHHLFYYNVDEVTEAGVRRFLSRVGVEHIDDLFKVREADRIGSGVPKAVPYKLRHLRFMIDKVRHDPLSPKMLKVNGGDVMTIAGLEPGPKIGRILAVLLEEVLDDPAKNDREDLKDRVFALAKLSDEELEKLAQRAKKTKEEFESGIVEEMKKKHYVK